MRKVALIDLAVGVGLFSFVFTQGVASSANCSSWGKALDLVGASDAYAQSSEEKKVKSEEKGKEEKDNEPESLEPGVIATAGTSNSRSVGLDTSLNTGLTDAKLSPILASISYQNGRCLASITNSSKKNTYSLTYAVEGYDGTSKNFSKGFVSTLAPTKSASHDFSCKEGLSLRVALRKGAKKK